MTAKTSETTTATARPAQDSLSLDELLERAHAAWAASGAFSEQTLLRAHETAYRFTQRVMRQGAMGVGDLTPALCSGFVTAPTAEGRPAELTTQHARRTALRMYFRALRDLGLYDGDPTLDLHLPARTSTAARPLTDDEVTLCRVAARLGAAGSTSLQRAVCWALAEATAITSEITQVRVGDVDDAAAPRWVRLAGTKRARGRLGELTDWGSRVMSRQLEMLHERGAGSHTLVTYRGAGAPGQHVAQAAVCNAIGEVLTAADLAAEPDVRPTSVRNWAGRALYDAGMPIERVAVRLGARSLDSVAEDIALHWWP
ncbi:tyrosine-type recombinase/integrase [Cellulomonas septica]|uniref:tyrosine-type recombinase/integrase n=1 Tax=Cellulomonas septica TaxID=285080 RepID=UPI001445ABCF